MAVFRKIMLSFMFLSAILINLISNLTIDGAFSQSIPEIEEFQNEASNKISVLMFVCNIIFGIYLLMGLYRLERMFAGKNAIYDHVNYSVSLIYYLITMALFYVVSFTTGISPHLHKKYDEIYTNNLLTPMFGYVFSQSMLVIMIMFTYRLKYCCYYIDDVPQNLRNWSLGSEEEEFAKPLIINGEREGLNNRFDNLDQYDYVPNIREDSDRNLEIRGNMNFI